mgnify:CR=1 FL=1
MTYENISRDWSNVAFIDEAFFLAWYCAKRAWYIYQMKFNCLENCQTSDKSA